VYVVLKDQGSRLSRVFALFGLAALVLTIGIFFASDPVLADRAWNIQTGSHRLGIAYGSLRLIADHPLLGVGFGAFDEVLPKYLPNYLLGAQVSIATSHMTLLTLVAELGVVGAFWLIAFIVMALRQSRNPVSLMTSEERLLNTVCVGFVLAFVVNAFLIDMRFFSLPYCWFFISLGMIRNLRTRAPTEVTLV
jgi:O-antigen ligase